MFIGYHADTAASVILQVCQSYHTDDEPATQQVHNFIDCYSLICSSVYLLFVYFDFITTSVLTAVFPKFILKFLPVSMAWWVKPTALAALTDWLGAPSSMSQVQS